MFQKNVPGWERVLRGVVGIAGTAGGGVLALTGNVVWGLVVAATGVTLAITAFSGWCPLCATVGRTLPQVDKKVNIPRL